MTRTTSDVLLADLIASAREGTVDYILLQAVIEEASEAGAVKALSALGLSDASARRDMEQLRDLLGAWRDVKRSAWQTVAKWVVGLLLATLVIGMAYRLKLTALLGSKG